MTLLELLRQELPKRGGWPDGADVISTNGYGHVWSYKSKGCVNMEGKELGIYSSEEGCVNREQYEATGWDGTGLPPVGCPVEVDSPRHGWTQATVTAVTDNWIIAKYSDGVEFAGCHRSMNSDGSCTDNHGLFRPLRTEAEKLREDGIAEMLRALYVPQEYTYREICELIYDAGYRKEIK